MKILVATNKMFLFLFCLIITKANQAQFPFPTQIDTIAVKVKSFTAEDFIKSTKKDTSFYRAFKNLRIFNHLEKSKVIVFSKKEKKGEKREKASMNRISTHTNKDNISTIVIDKETTKGKYYKKNGDYRFFTSEMFDRVFFSLTPKFASNTVSTPYQQKDPQNRSKKEKYYEQLKTFMFSPGTRVEGVPLIGDKLDIFSKKMRPYYDFTLEKYLFQDSIKTYRFVCSRKKEVKESKVVIQYLETLYDRRTMNIIARKYRIKDQTILFDFDIKMTVQLQKIDKEYFPSVIKYMGDWDIPFKKRERLAFEIKTELTQQSPTKK